MFENMNAGETLKLHLAIVLCALAGVHERSGCSEHRRQKTCGSRNGQKINISLKFLLTKRNERLPRYWHNKNIEMTSVDANVRRLNLFGVVYHVTQMRGVRPQLQLLNHNLESYPSLNP